MEELQVSAVATGPMYPLSRLDKSQIVTPIIDPNCIYPIRMSKTMVRGHLGIKRKREQIWRLLGSFSLEHRQFLTLKYINGFTYDLVYLTLKFFRGMVMSKFSVYGELFWSISRMSRM